MKSIISLLIICSFFSCQTENEQTIETAEREVKVLKPRNIILMIGDGMGVTQVTAAMYANGNKLALEKTTHTGLMKTAASDKLITDSAAGATAFSIGKKAYNGAVGIDKDSVAHETILERAKREGLSTGLIATASLQHATPACFYAHQPSRKMFEEITDDFIKNPVDFFVAGGKKYFTERKDGRNLLDSLSAKNVTLFPEIKNISGEGKAGVFVADEEPLSILRGRESYLPEATKTGIQRLSKNEKGFFLMVEGSQIDWGGHDNDSDYIIEEMLEFDQAIEQALAFAEKDGNTLVIITADHETGGYAINGGKLDGSEIKAGFTTAHHTAVMVPVFAFGPGAEKFTGIYENTAIYDKMMQLWGY